ncbi:hypothetical protein LIER_09208 [Lithospermum erythrorhizon]|uniref:CSC1-like protein RXW8 n=1 Tax=Lithospermum erythrorhizon TaxID=34254 RepID=A0AAV3PG48_LITER
MNLSALLTSAGINTAICVVLFSLYSVLRKQPSLVNVYFGQRLAQKRVKDHDPYWLDRFVPSASWIMKAWEASEDELLEAGGLDAVVFLRAVVFSIRIFSIVAIICLFVVIPLNYYGQEMRHDSITAEPLAVFTIDNIQEGSKWLWVHCFSLYVISGCACFLLYHEYIDIMKMRLVTVTTSLSAPSYFTVLVRGIPWSLEDSYSGTVSKFFSNYYASSYLSHQMVYQSGPIKRIVTLKSDAEKLYHKFKHPIAESRCRPMFMKCGLCGGSTPSFKRLACDSEPRRNDFGGSKMRTKECAAALVFFRSRYAALVASQSIQSSHPMTWVTDPAPEPRDVYWSNLCVPYQILWIRRIFIFVASIALVIFYLAPVVLVQSLVQYDKLQALQKIFPVFKGIFQRRFMSQILTGYLPSVILMLFMYLGPPIMFFFSTLEGSISRSRRKRSACIKVLFFIIWNVFFGNYLSGSVLDRIGRASNVSQISKQLARAVPLMAKFFMTYVMTSGWASLSCELIQPFGLLYYYFYRYILRYKDDSSYGTMTFPYHTEVPRVLLFGLLGFTCSIFAPLILPLLLVYFFLAYLVYRNQILNVYETKYQSGGLYWPIVHYSTIFSLVVTQLIALGVFGIKKSKVASSFMFPLIIATLLFNEYCRQRFHPIFKDTAAQVVIEMDRQDEASMRMEEIHAKLPSSYCQFSSKCNNMREPIPVNDCEIGTGVRFEELEGLDHDSPTLVIRP